MSDWPSEDVLRKLLELPLAGFERDAIERYLERPQHWRAKLEREDRYRHVRGNPVHHAGALKENLTACVRCFWAHLVHAGVV